MTQNWAPLPLSDAISENGRVLVKIEGRKIAVFQTEGGLFACDNRCPHEGYPLIEGTIGKGCRLTCNWHSWTFDLKSGAALAGRDPVRTYAIREDSSGVWIDLTDPPRESQIAQAMKGLEDALDVNDYSWIARSLARLMAAGGDPREAMQHTLNWSRGRFEYGFNHAHAVAADWLELAEGGALPGRKQKLAAYLEAISYFADAGQGGRHFPFPDHVEKFREADFLTALEAQNENRAIALLNGALADGLSFFDLEPVLARAAFRHYHSFGHSLIYLTKTAALIDRLGAEVAPALLRAYVRSLINASREDLIPEFRAYAAALESWNGSGEKRYTASDFSGQSVGKCLSMTVEGSRNPAALMDSLLGAAALNMLRFDPGLMIRTDQPISRNVSWLDFTHAITFGSAVRFICEKYPQLWPAGLLQMACFVGRNAAFLKQTTNLEKWRVEDEDMFFAEQIGGLIDHGEPAYIYAAHRVKTLMAVRREAPAASDTARPLLLAALQRYLSNPMKQKHVLRTASQAVDFIGGK